MSKQGIDKQKLINKFKEVLMNRVATLEQAVEDAQASANGEEKSSAGDKYETGREMSRQSRDMFANQLLVAQKDLNIFNKIKGEPKTEVELGSLISVNGNLYYVSLACGKVEIDGKEVMALSQVSPFVQKLKGLKAGGEAMLNGKKLIVDWVS